MNRYIPFASGTAVCGVPGTGWQWMVTVSVPSAVSTQTFSVLVNGVAQTALTGSQVYGPIALEDQELLTVTGGTVYAGQSVLVAGDVRYVGVGEANPPPNSFNVLAYGADPTGANDSTASWQAAAADAQKQGGVVWAYGTYKLSGLPLYSGVYYQGAGPVGTTIVGANIRGLFANTLVAGSSLTDCGISDMTIDGVTGPTGTTEGVHLDSSASSNILTRGICFRRVHFKNCLAGINHAGNNASAGPMNNKVVAEDCVFENCAAGYELSGTYGVEIRNCHGLQNTVATVLNPQLQTGGAPNSGTGPTTVTRISGLHVEGLGNLTGGGTGNDWGIAYSGSATRITDCEISNVSQSPIHFGSQEGIGSLISDITIWGAGGPGFLGDGDNDTELTAIINYVMSYTNRNPGIAGYYGAWGAMNFGGGAWDVDNVLVADASVNPPPHAMQVGYNAPNQLGQVRVSRFSCTSTSTGLFVLVAAESQTPMVLRISDSPGYNPVGPTTVAVPSSGTATAALPYDATFYITQATAASSVAVQGQTIAIPVGGPTAIRVPAGQTLTPTYSTAPTWVVMGE